MDINIILNNKLMKDTKNLNVIKGIINSYDFQLSDIKTKQDLFEERNIIYDKLDFYLGLRKAIVKEQHKTR